MNDGVKISENKVLIIKLKQIERVYAQEQHMATLANDYGVVQHSRSITATTTQTLKDGDKCHDHMHGNFVGRMHSRENSESKSRSRSRHSTQINKLNRTMTTAIEMHLGLSRGDTTRDAQDGDHVGAPDIDGDSIGAIGVTGATGSGGGELSRQGETSTLGLLPIGRTLGIDDEAPSPSPSPSPNLRSLKESRMIGNINRANVTSIDISMGPMGTAQSMIRVSSDTLTPSQQSNYNGNLNGNLITILQPVHVGKFTQGETNDDELETRERAHKSQVSETIDEDLIAKAFRDAGLDDDDMDAYDSDNDDFDNDDENTNDNWNTNLNENKNKQEQQKSTISQLSVVDQLLETDPQQN